MLSGRSPLSASEEFDFRRNGGTSSSSSFSFSANSIRFEDEHEDETVLGPQRAEKNLWLFLKPDDCGEISRQFNAGFLRCAP